MTEVISSTDPALKARIKEHYDVLSTNYQELWGQNIHHGYWITGDESKDVAQDQLMQELAKQGGVTQNATILDVGCGVGGGSVFLAKNYNANVTGITISTSQVKMATEYAAKENAAVKFMEMDAEKINIPELENKCDFVWIVEAMSHFPNKKAFLGHANRMLHKGGRIIIADWFKSEHLTPQQEEGNLKLIEDGMLLPGLNTMFDYISMLHASGFRLVYSRDISKQTAKTWDICLSLITSPGLWKLAYNMGRDFVTFLKSFTAMRDSFCKEFLYCVLVAEKVVDL